MELYKVITLCEIILVIAIIGIVFLAGLYVLQTMSPQFKSCETNNWTGNYTLKDGNNYSCEVLYNINKTKI